MKTRLKFIRKLFKLNHNAFREYSKSSKLINSDKVVWSNSFLDFCPYESEMNQLAAPVIYSCEPKNKTQSTVMAKSVNGRIYFAAKCENENWGTQFYLYKSGCEVCENANDGIGFTEKNKQFLQNENYTDDALFKVRLLYNDQNDDEKMRLAQIEFVLFGENDRIEETLYYTFDKDENEETFFRDCYTYDSHRIASIERNGFYEDPNNMLDTRIFRFEYLDGGHVEIYSKQLGLNKEVKEQQIYSGKMINV